MKRMFFIILLIAAAFGIQPQQATGQAGVALYAVTAVAPVLGGCAHMKAANVRPETLPTAEP